MTTKVDIPGHVAAESVYDFDFYADKRYGSNVHKDMEVLHQEAPGIFYTPRNGGHWIATRHAIIADIVQDPENFSVREMQIPRVETPPVFIPLSLDPPNNLPYRQALMPLFSPKSIKQQEDTIRHWAKSIINDATNNKTECDFLQEVTELFPISIFMELMGMDLSRLREFRSLAEKFFSVQNDSDQLNIAVGQIVGIMTEYIEQKKVTPDNGLISHLLKTQVGDRPISMEELQNMCLLFFAGGMHTVTNLLGFAYWELAGNTQLQKRLAEDHSLIPQFVEESIRLFGVINTPRIVAKDVEKFGVKFCKDDMILCMLPLAGRDESLNDNASVFDIDRKNRQSLTFSKGAHLCIGHFLARSEIRILTEEWLKRVPQFRLKAGVTQQKYTTSTGLGLTSLPLEWD